MSSSTEQAEISPKHAGDGVAAAVVQDFDELRHVTDSEATWYDAETTALLTPGDPSWLRFGGVCLVETDTPVEIKAALVRRSNGDRDTPGHFYIKQATHNRLADADGVYLFVVYVPRGGGLRQLGRIVVPAATVGDILTDSWYDVAADRSEDSVAQLSWTRVLDEGQLVRGGVR